MTQQVGNQTVMDPQMTDILFRIKSDIFKSLNAVKVGQILSFDTAKKTAQVQILFKRVVPDAAGVDGQSILPYPVLVDCPVVTLQGGGAALRMPIAAGDQCLLFFADRNIDIWFKNGSEAAPFDARCHDLSDGFALVGVNALTSTLANYKTDEVELVYGTAIFGMKGDKLKIKNAATDLLTAITGLITVIQAVQTTTSIPLSAASIADLEAQKAIFQALLYSI